METDCLQCALLRFSNRSFLSIETLAKEGFEKFEQNWLLIYDNWSLPAPDREKAANFLLPKIRECNSFANFDSVYIITGNFINNFSNTGIVQHEINDLWK